MPLLRQICCRLATFDFFSAFHFATRSCRCVAPWRGDGVGSCTSSLVVAPRARRKEASLSAALAAA
eukprot:3473789-Prymnesium_polylepis.1